MDYVQVVGLFGAVVIAWLVLVVLFTPGINYHVRGRVDAASAEFLHVLQSTCQAAVHEGNRVEIFADGRTFYPAMLEAIGGATRSVNLECYIFQPGAVADDFIAALTARAAGGVAVTIVVDAVGSAGLSGEPLRRLRAGGCRIESYQSITWHSLHRLNNRTHRELLVVDGRVAFVGGAGIADWWLTGSDGGPPWRDTMARVEGPIVAALQGVFVENWLESCGEIMAGDDDFPPLAPEGDVTAFVVRSSPADRATASRVVFQLLIEGAVREVRISTPYFLPDRSLRLALIDAARRGVKISVIVPGRQTDQRWVRLASRRLYGTLLEHGVRIFEYGRSMMHVKVLIIDDRWTVLGTTNIDNRSFEHNDELNVAMRNESVAARLAEDYGRDLEASTEMTVEAWRRRPLWEKAIGGVAWILERQQ